MAELAPGAIAPDFTLPRDGGGSISLSALRGRPVQFDGKTVIAPELSLRGPNGAVAP